MEIIESGMEDAADRGGLATARALAVLLDRRARHRTVRAEHAAIASKGLKPGATALAVIKELAGVCRHGFDSLVLTGRTGQGRFQLHPGTVTIRAITDQSKQATAKIKLGHQGLKQASTANRDLC
jgi:hypothetical protein